MLVVFIVKCLDQRLTILILVFSLSVCLSVCLSVHLYSSIASTLPEALSEFASNLNIIHQEISPKGRDGRQNFTVRSRFLLLRIREL